MKPTFVTGHSNRDANLPEIFEGFFFEVLSWMSEIVFSKEPMVSDVLIREFDTDSELMRNENVLDLSPLSPRLLSEHHRPILSGGSGLWRKLVFHSTLIIEHSFSSFTFTSFSGC